jgi:pyruvate-ferredoxin/flavodoxin oxidoreductase
MVTTLGQSLDQQKLAVDTGFWPLYRFDPRRVEAGEPGLKLDSAAPKVPLEKFWATERRFQTIASQNPQVGKAVLEAAQQEVLSKFALYERMSASADVTVKMAMAK